MTSQQPEEGGWAGPVWDHPESRTSVAGVYRRRCATANHHRKRGPSKRDEERERERERRNERNQQQAASRMDRKVRKEAVGKGRRGRGKREPIPNGTSTPTCHSSHSPSSLVSTTETSPSRYGINAKRRNYAVCEET